MPPPRGPRDGFPTLRQYQQSDRGVQPLKNSAAGRLHQAQDNGTISLVIATYSSKSDILRSMVASIPSHTINSVMALVLLTARLLGYLGHSTAIPANPANPTAVSNNLSSKSKHESKSATRSAACQSSTTHQYYFHTRPRPTLNGLPTLATETSVSVTETTTATIRLRGTFRLTSKLVDELCWWQLSKGELDNVAYNLQWPSPWRAAGCTGYTSIRCNTPARRCITFYRRDR